VVAVTDPKREESHGFSRVEDVNSESTITYYRGVDRGIHDALGGHAAGDPVIRSVNFGDIERFIRTEQWENAGEYLATAAADLECENETSCCC